MRPKGLGLGADRSVLENANKALSNKKQDEELKLITGAFVQFISGKQQGLYGQVSYLVSFFNIDLNVYLIIYRFLAWMQIQDE